MRTIRYRHLYLDAGVRASQSLVLRQASSRHRIAYTSPLSIASVLEASKLAFAPVPPRCLPEGAVFEAGHRMAGSPQEVLYRAFTDDLDTISFFERPVTGPSARSRAMRAGTGQEKVLARTSGALAYALIGDVPGEELRKIAPSAKER